MEREGFATTFQGETGGVLFAYLDTPRLGGMLIELIEGLAG